MKSIFIATLALLIPHLSHASTTDWQNNPHGRVRLITPYKVAPTRGKILMGVDFEGAPGWHLYWSDPGDAGMAPKFTWEGSTGFSNAKTLYPAPHHYVLPGDLKANGYEGEVVYPVQAEVIGTPSTLHVVAKIYYLTCKDSCIPYTYHFTFDLPAAPTPVMDPTSSALVDRYLAAVPATDRSGISAQEAPMMPAAPTAAPVRLWLMILVGFVGGLILNVMPCVLPVLAIKLFGLLQNSGKTRARSIIESLSSAGGIIFSYLTLGTIIILLRRTGHAVGWGIQFQQPIFVGIMAVIVFGFAFNLWGFFEINLPRIFGNFAVSYGRGESIPAYFVSGIFATLLATPCSAPFLGTAMGFAFVQPAPIVLSIFLSAGIGMALPYLLLAVFPESLSWLPRPGQWMIRVRQALGFLLAATGVWLLTVLTMQLHPSMPTLPSSAMETTRAGQVPWMVFDEAEIAKQLKGGKSVFVDVTAAWCFTCKYNERFVLATPAVTAALRRPNLVLMRADWTNPNPAIDSFLKEYGRAGIPFYAYFRPGKPPVLLSELLTNQKVLQALAR